MIDNKQFNSWFNTNYEIIKGNKIKQIGKNRYLTESDVYSQYAALCASLRTKSSKS